ncbi:cation:proton antiporter [Nonomuraea sp. NPDC000554]|uniref:cation:proton antiporter n=1 Tax=Nonomuraea sp. NPDC000554 TaxID=3154259 RepID=UPI00331A028B
MAPIAPIGAHALLLLLLQIGVLLLLALALGRLAVRLKLPAVVGELTAGVLLGPSLFFQVSPDLSAWLIPHEAEQFHLLDAVGQIGVLLLVGITGAHLDTKLIRKQGAAAVKVSGFGLVIPLGLGVATGLLLPQAFTGGKDQTVFALFLGVAMCVSAIPVIAKTLIDMNLMHRNIGQLTLTAGMVDDAFGWLMLSVVSAMATTGLHTGNVLLSLAYLAGVLLFAAVIGRPLVRKVYQLAARSADAVPTIASTVVLILLASAGSHALGLEPIFGAFVMGVLISASGRPDPARLAPLRTVVLAVLAPIFFATAGLRMDLTALARPDVLGLAVLILAIAIAGKFAGAYLGALTSRLNKWEALALGAGMNARGVVEVIVAMVGLRLGVISTEVFTIIILVAVITSVIAPPILRVAMARVQLTPEEDERRKAHLGLATPVLERVG